MSQEGDLIRPVMTVNDAASFLTQWFNELKELRGNVTKIKDTTKDAEKEQEEELFSIREVNSFEDRNFVFKLPSDISVSETSERTFILRVANLIESKLPAQLGVSPFFIWLNSYYYSFVLKPFNFSNYFI